MKWGRQPGKWQVTDRKSFLGSTMASSAAWYCLIHAHSAEDLALQHAIRPKSQHMYSTSQETPAETVYGATIMVGLWVVAAEGRAGGDGEAAAAGT